MWFWEDGAIEIYCFCEGGLYEKVAQSEQLPDIDILLPTILGWQTNTTPFKASSKPCARSKASLTF
jgi:hypothetical protein